MLRISMLPLFLALLGLSGGCQHPCQANPGQCPGLTLDVKVAPLVSEYPALIQRLAPNLAFELTLSTSDQSKFSDVSAYFCPSGSNCRDGCPDSKQPLTLPAPVLSANVQGQTYTIPKDTVALLPQGPARLCVSILSDALPELRVYAWKDVWVVNQLLKSASSKIANPAFSIQVGSTQYTPLSLDFGIDSSGTTRAVALGESMDTRDVRGFKLPGFSEDKYAFTYSPSVFFPTNRSLRFVSVGRNTILLAQEKALGSNPLVAFLCPLGATSATCSSPTTNPGWVIASGSANSVSGDSQSDRFIVSLDSGPDSLRAFDTKLMTNMAPAAVWKAAGPTESVVLVAAPLRALTARKVSDVVVVGRTAATPDARSVMVFLAEEGVANPNTQADASVSAALGIEIKRALGERQLVAMSAGDLDGDRLAEIVLLSKSASNARLHVLFNLGNGRFRSAGDLYNPETSVDLEASLKSLVTLSDAVDLKVQNLDGADMTKWRPELVVLGNQSIQVHSLD